MQLIMLYITTSSKDEARKVAKHLLERRLIACGNVYEGINSIYRWKDEVVDGPECVLIAKTVSNLFERIKQEVRSVHSYEVPCIVKIPVEANEDFAAWVMGEVSEE